MNEANCKSTIYTCPELSVGSEGGFWVNIGQTGQSAHLPKSNYMLRGATHSACQLVDPTCSCLLID